MAILRYIPLAVIAPMLMTGCYEDFTPDVDTKPVLCLNSMITAGETIEVDVTRTWLYTDIDSWQNHDVDDAVVTVYVNGTAVDDEYRAQEGDRIRIVAESGPYGMAEAEVTVPRRIEIKPIVWNAELTERWSNTRPEWEMNADIRFNLSADITVCDRAEVADYYHYAAAVYYPGMDDDSGMLMGSRVDMYTGQLNYRAEPIFSEHTEVIDAINGSDPDGFTFFTDRQFAGSEYTLHIRYNNMGYNVRSMKYDEQLFDSGIHVVMSTVSGSFYDWENFVWHVNNGAVTDIGSTGLGDAVWGYSNVSTGAGVVAARTISVYRIDLSEFLEKSI